MKKISILILLITTVLLQSCTLQGECEGEIIVANPLPDITIQLEDGKQTIDLSSPPVYEHTAQKNLAISAHILGDGVKIVGTGIQKNPDTGEFNLLVIEPLQEGTATIIVEAGDDCLDGTRDEFEVAIN